MNPGSEPNPQSDREKGEGQEALCLTSLALQSTTPNETTAAAATTPIWLWLKCCVADKEPCFFIFEVQPTGTVLHTEKKPKEGEKKINRCGLSHALQDRVAVLKVIL